MRTGGGGEESTGHRGRRSFRRSTGDREGAHVGGVQKTKEGAQIG